jgi:hypothetical protein
MLFTSAALAFSAADIEARVRAVHAVREDRLGTLAPAIPDDAYPTLAKGAVATGLTAVEGKHARIAWGLAVLDAPVAAVFSAVNDDRNKPDYSKLAHVELIEGDYCAERRLVFQYLPIPVVSDRWWVIEQRINADAAARSDGAVREMVWMRERDGLPHLDASQQERVARAVQAEENDGGWWMVALDEQHTLVQFWALSDPGGNIPVRLAGPFAAGSIRDTFEMMESLAQKGPSCTL